MTQFTQSAPGVDVSPPNAEANYRQMLRIRRFEERVYQLFVRNVVHGTTHLGIGQEAIAVGFAAALRPDDYTLATYRGHAHALARGASLAASFGELFGRASGLCKGKGGVDDIEATVKELEAKGVTFFSPINVVDEGLLAGWRWVYFSDPDGITLELVEVAYTRDEERRRGVEAYLASRKVRATT